MRPFEYIRPTTIPETTSFLRDNADVSLVISGGSAAVVMLQLGVIRPRYVVDLGGIDALRITTVPDDSLHLGSLTTIRWLETTPVVQDRFGLLAEAASQVANVRVRNVATAGGAVAYGEPQTDTPTALTALGATVRVAGPESERGVPIEEFYLGPYETVLAPDELVVGIDVANPGQGTAGCHAKFTIGSPENKPVANASVLVGIDQATERCTSARIAMGAVGPIPIVAEAANGLVGEVLNAQRVSEVASVAADQTDPIEDLRGPVWYKRRIIKVLVERALMTAIGRATA